MEHAIAILLGKAPADFSLPVVPLAAKLPGVPVGLPSALLERRPDVASAERAVAKANANIGVATAAMFPALSLSASGGYQNNSFAQWFNAPSQIWSLGAALAQPLFEGGLLKPARTRPRPAMTRWWRPIGKQYWAACRKWKTTWLPCVCWMTKR